MTPDGTDAPVRDRLRRALPAAMKQRDADAVAALRAALGALDNAGAVALAPDPGATAGASGPIAGAVTGLGRSEVERRALTEADAQAVVEAQIAEREEAIALYSAGGRAERADALRREAQALRAVLDA